MKRLILMRHAKSDWSNPANSDHERGLNERGIKSAKAVGVWLHRQSLRPNHILCSDATRTRDTLTLLDFQDVQTDFNHNLYLAEPEVMVRLITKQTADCILVVAHNPGTVMLASRLVIRSPLLEGFDNFPTCATLVTDFNIQSWQELRMESGTVVDFVVPRSLIK